MNSRIKHDCNHCQEQIATVLDGSCSQMERQQVLKQLNDCPRCNAKFQQAESFKTFIHNSYPKKTASPSLLRSIRDGIRDIR